MDAAACAWLAGFFDGEGNVGGHRQTTGTIRPVIQIVQKDETILRRLHEATGLGGIYQMRKEPGRECWLWRLTSRADVLAFVALVRPYVRLKGEALDLARELAELPPGPSARKEEIRQALRVRPIARVA